MLVAQSAASEDAIREVRTTLLRVAGELLDEAQISYVYGGFQVGDGDECRQCNDCLDAKSPRPKERLALCGVCVRCSLDCSHFAELVHRKAGVGYPYLDTKTMLALSAERLLRNYRLKDMGTDLAAAEPGDLLVYEGHVVVLERTHAPQPDLALYRGDVVHATGGKDVRGPGEGIQRERFVDLAGFRGPLLRILRNAALAGLVPMPIPSAVPPTFTTPPVTTVKPAPIKARKRLRPVEKRPSGG